MAWERTRTVMASARVLPARARNLSTSLRSLRASERAAGPIDAALGDLRRELTELRERVDAIEPADATVAPRRRRVQRPLRIVAANSLYPLITETYIGDELEALRRSGVDMVLSRMTAGNVHCPSAVHAPLFDSLPAAIEHHDPDLVLCHWSGVARALGPIAAALGVPHAVRLHSFCAGFPDEELFGEWSVGAWGFHHAPRQSPLWHALPTLILDPEISVPEDSARSRSVLSVSAGLPKKAWPNLIEACRRLRDVELQVIVGTTDAFEHVPGEVTDACRAAGLPHTVRVDVPYAETQAAVRATGAVVYSIAPGVAIGQPRSVIEAALACTPLVLPDLPPLRQQVGAVAAYYAAGDPQSLSAAIERALTEPAPLAERLALAERIRRAHVASDYADRWRVELTQAIEEWRARRESTLSPLRVGTSN